MPGSRPVTVFLVFLLGYVLSQFFRAFLAVIAPELSAELGLSKADLGLISSAWFLAFAAAQFAVGPALDRIGPRRTVFATMIAAVAGAALFAASDGLATAALAMALIGVGCSAVYMGALFVFARTLAPERFAGLASVLIGLGSVGNLLGATPLALAAATVGWRPSLLAMAGVTAVAALLVLLLVRDPPRLPATAPSAVAVLRRMVADRGLRLLFPITLVSYAVVATERGLWIGPFLSEVYGLDAIARGNGVFAMALAMSVGAFLYAPLDRLLGTRKWVAFAGTVATGVLLLVLAIAPGGVGQAIALLSLIGMCGLTFGVLMGHGRTFFADAEVGQGLTLLNALFIGGAAILQPLSGLFMDIASESIGREGAYALMHAGFGALLLATAAIYMAAPEPRRPLS